MAGKNSFLTLAAVWLGLGVVDLVAINVWLVPNAWPPEESQPKIAQLTDIPKSVRPGDQVDKPVDQVDKPVDQVDKPVDQVDKPVDQVDKPVDQVDKPEDLVALHQIEPPDKPDIPVDTPPADSVEPSALTPPEGIQVLKETVLRYETGKVWLRRGQKKKLSGFIASLKHSPGSILFIEGHADRRGRDNEKLSEDRALAVVYFFTSRGIKNEQIRYVGYGANKPLASGNTQEAWAKNRRVVVRIQKGEP